MMNKTRLLELASALVLAGVTNKTEEIEKISKQLAAELRLTDEENGGKACACPPLGKDFYGFLKFNDKEISKMPKSFRHTFIAEGKVIFYRRRKRGKLYGSFTFEARYRRHGYNISVSAKTIEELKENFIRRLHAVESGADELNVPNNFDEFSLYWFKNFHKRKVKANTYKHDIELYNRHIKQAFGKLRINVITPVALQRFLDGFADRPKTAKDLHSILNQIFDCATKHGLIKLNPIGMCFLVNYEKQHGKLITREEEAKLFTAFAGTKFQVYFAVVIYTGLRPDEYISATIDGKFIKAKNSKHGKSGEIIYKRIPITPMLRPFLEGVEELNIPNQRIMTRRFKKALPEHKLYDMRTTFQTRCTECGLSESVIGVFMGNSIGKLKDAYTNFSEEYLLQEGEKFKY